MWSGKTFKFSIFNVQFSTLVCDTIFENLKIENLKVLQDLK